MVKRFIIALGTLLFEFAMPSVERAAAESLKDAVLRSVDLTRGRGVFSIIHDTKNPRDRMATFDSTDVVAKILPDGNRKVIFTVVREDVGSEVRTRVFEVEFVLGGKDEHIQKESECLGTDEDEKACNAVRVALERYLNDNMTNVTLNIHIWRNSGRTEEKRRRASRRLSQDERVENAGLAVTITPLPRLIGRYRVFVVGKNGEITRVLGGK